MVVRVGRVTLLLRNQGKPHTITPLPVTAVWTREKGTTPAGENPIDWMLLTNREVTSLEHARQVIAGYAAGGAWRNVIRLGKVTPATSRTRSFEAPTQ